MIDVGDQLVPEEARDEPSHSSPPSPASRHPGTKSSWPSWPRSFAARTLVGPLSPTAGAVSPPATRAPTAIQLALPTDTGSGHLDSSGKLILLMDNRPVWAISWLGIQCPPRTGGPPVLPSPSSTNTPVATTQPICDRVAFVDALSGAFIFTYTSPHH